MEDGGEKECLYSGFRRGLGEKGKGRKGAIASEDMKGRGRMES
jgi:hypothetical protein